MAEVRLEDVSFTYPGAEAPTIADLSLTIASGEAHALLGASGAGKTTLLNLLSGLLTPTAGRVYLDGDDVTALSGRARRVSQVFQFPVLYEAMTVADNLAFPLRTRRMAPAEIGRRVAAVAEALGLTDALKVRPRGLSLYQKQLVAVGKALTRPDVSLVLLDEPLTAVEPRVKWDLRRVLKAVQAELGVTMIYVTHDQTEALTFADRVSLLTVDGILQSDTPEALYERPAHRDVGHFVGSPGMNFVRLDTGVELGFRPEWARLAGSALQADGPSLAGKVTHVRVHGAVDGEPVGLSTVATERGTIVVRGPVIAAQGAAVHIDIHRHLVFADGLLTEASAEMLDV